MSGEAVLVPLIWESITGVAEAVEAALGSRKEAARRAAEVQRERIQAWKDLQSRQQQAQALLSRSREAVRQVRQALIDGGLRQAATRVHGEAVAEGYVEQVNTASDENPTRLMAHIDRQFNSLPAGLLEDEQLPFARLRAQLWRMQQAADATFDEVDALAGTLQRSFAAYVKGAGQEAEQQRRQVENAEQLLTQILEARELSVNGEHGAELQRLQEKLVDLLARGQITPAALDVISRRYAGLRDKVERALAEDEMNEFLTERVTYHLNAMGYRTHSAFSERRAGARRDAEFVLPDGDRLRVALQADLKMGFQLSHETQTMVEKTLSGEAMSFFRQQEARWCRDMKELIRRLIEDGVPYEVQFEREIPDESIPVVAVEMVDELLEEVEEEARRHRCRKERYFR
jgi:hypothetical protein